MKGLSWIIDLIEAARVGTIQNRRLIEREDAQNMDAAVNVYFDLAEKSVQSGAIVGQQDEADWKVAQVCKEQYEELLHVLMPQIPD